MDTRWGGVIALALGLLHGAASADTVKVGLSAPLTGIQKSLGTEAAQVWQAFADYAKETGMLTTHSIAVTVVDDEFNAAMVKTNATRFVESDIDVMVSTPGIPHIIGIMPMLEKARLPLLGPGSGSPDLRNKSPALFHVKATVGDEVLKVAGILGAHKLPRVAIVTDDIPDRVALAETFRKALEIESQGKSAVSGVFTIPQKGGDAVATAKEVAKTKPDAIFVMAIAGISPVVIKTLRQGDFPGPLYSWSIAATKDTFSSLGEAARGVAFSVVMPNPSSQRTVLARQFQKFAAAKGISPSFRSMELYVTGLVLVDALNRIKSKEVTRRDVWQALEQVKSLNVGGYVVSYTPTDQNGSKFVDIVILGKNGRFVE